MTTDNTEIYAQILKRAFVPMGAAKEAQQAPGPDGMPVDPAAGGDPMAGGDPAAGGMPPMDPAMMGGDPAAGGMPPMDPAMMDPAMMGGDPAAGGMPPMDPAMMDPGMMEPPAEEGGGEGLTSDDAEIVERLTQSTVDRTMDIVERTLSAVGKGPKKPGQDVGGPAADATPAGDAAGDLAAQADALAQEPGPVTGQPGFNPDSVGGAIGFGVGGQ